MFLIEPSLNYVLALFELAADSHIRSKRHMLSEKAAHLRIERDNKRRNKSSESLKEVTPGARHHKKENKKKRKRKTTVPDFNRREP